MILSPQLKFSATLYSQLWTTSNIKSISTHHYWSRFQFLALEIKFFVFCHAVECAVRISIGHGKGLLWNCKQEVDCTKLGQFDKISLRAFTAVDALLYIWRDMCIGKRPSFIGTWRNEVSTFEYGIEKFQVLQWWNLYAQKKRNMLPFRDREFGEACETLKSFYRMLNNILLAPAASLKIALTWGRSSASKGNELVEQGRRKIRPS